ncbi:peptide deformylase [uncultured Alistipes sp.]|jgi:peptide deformylase|uniref:peptide deformylase n=1 Tax=uncultured Alistipes sp. TaxID=538949 RepID=UPI0025F823A2|nr:peptide deformylase [uncultured Alistipes sp.]
MKICVVLCVCLLSACAAPTGFTEDECRVIASQGGAIMRLCTTAGRSDSLFLRREAAALGRGELASDCFRLLKEGMLATVRDTTDAGVGIAAPQVGVSRRLIAVQRFDKPGKPFEFYVNPRIVWRSGTVSDGGEGCLSVPGVAGTVRRADSIVVSYLDERDMRTHADTVAGFTAVIFQHEIDHLDGVLFIDKMLPPGK